MKTKRVAVITTSMSHEANVLWQQLSHNYQIALIGPSRSGRVDPQSNVATYNLDVLPRSAPVLWRYHQGLIAALEHFNPDLIHVNAELWSVVALRVARRQWPYVVHGAENIWEHGIWGERQLRPLLVRGVLRRARGYASWNTAGAEHVAEIMGGEFPVAVVPAIIPPPAFWQTEWSPGDGGQFTVLLVGRLVREKGFHVVVEAMSRLAHRRKFKLLVCGDGEERDRLESMAREAEVDATFFGFRSAEELAKLMATSQLLVQPSLSTDSWIEQFGRTVAEAMAVGLPVVVSSSGELPNLPGRDPRWVYGEEKIEELAHILDKLSSDRVELLQFAAQQRIAAGRFTPEAAAEVVSHLWSRAL